MLAIIDLHVHMHAIMPMQKRVRITLPIR